VIAAWRDDYPNIRWEWRVFMGGQFVTYMNATVPEMIEAQKHLTFALDVECLTVDLL